MATLDFTAKEDVDVPIEAAFAMLSEYEIYERAAIRRGAEVVRLREPHPPGPGLMWRASFDLRGRRREVDIELVEQDRPNLLRLETHSAGLDGEVRAELIALSPRRTRLTLTYRLDPRTLSAKLLVQSLKLARTNLTKRLRLRVADFARQMEERYSRTA